MGKMDAQNGFWTYFLGVVVVGVVVELSLLVGVSLLLGVSLVDFALSPFLDSADFSDFDSDLRA